MSFIFRLFRGIMKELYNIMIDLKAIEKLAELSRISVSDGEKAKFLKDLESIISYVDQIKTAVGEAELKITGAEDEQKNVLREDGICHDRGQFTEALLACAPERENGYVKVKKIL